MDDGELGADDGTFFVSMKGEATEPALLWSEQYRLLKTSSCYLNAPNFLHTAAKKIFNVGKSVVFLKRLGSFRGPAPDGQRHKLHLDYANVCLSSPSASYIPFGELFDIAFDNWMRNKQHNSVSVLREHLFSQCSLWRSLDALEYIYFLKNGALSTTLATTIFDRLDRNSDAWNDRFILTELARSVYGTLDSVDASNLSVRSTSVKEFKEAQNLYRSVEVLTSIAIEYKLPWAVANIIKPSSTPIYQRIFTFLLQIRRGKHMLERQRLLISHHNPSASLASTSNTNTKGKEDNHIFSLRHHLLHFTTTLYTYLTSTVLGPSTAEMRSQMAVASDIDAMIAIHDSYIAHLENRCLLAENLAPIHRAIISLLDLVVEFADVWAEYTGEKRVDHREGGREGTESGSQGISQNRSGKRRGRAYESAEESSSSSDDEQDDAAHDPVPNSTPLAETTSCIDRLLNIREQYERLFRFVSVGLQAVGRTGSGSGSGSGGEACWEVLGDMLSWVGATGGGRGD